LALPSAREIKSCRLCHHRVVVVVNGNIIIIMRAIRNETESLRRKSHFDFWVIFIHFAAFRAKRAENASEMAVMTE
jgi:hypothetical protein